MKLLLDTHLLLWSAGKSSRLSAAASRLLNNPENQLVFSAASLWEIAIKRGLGRVGLVEPRMLRRELLHRGYEEMAILSEHAMAVETLPAVHKDPFDRILVAQALVEGMMLVTVEPQMTQYPGTIRKV